jgi:enoyl-CoA hydratase/carnithine racemase
MLNIWVLSAQPYSAYAACKNEDNNVKYKTIEFKERNGVCIIILNRSGKLNAISAEMTEELQHLLAQLRRNKTRVVILTGRGRAFCSGVDLSEIKKRRAADAFERRNAALFDEIESFPGVTIAAINGLAYGGGMELCLACDLRFASNQAVFCLPEVKLGIIPSAGALRRLPPLVGFSAAKELILTMKKMPASEASAIGLIHHIESPENLLKYCMQRALEIVELNQDAIVSGKSILNAAMKSVSPDQIAVESFAQALLFQKRLSHS